MDKYDHQEIEKKWQKYWEDNDFYHAEDFSEKPKKYILFEFPYPSGDGLHVGHTRSYSALDAIARKKRMEGFNVLFPIGWDAFGLPTENYAIKTGTHPREATKKNIANFRRQLKSLGMSLDWEREIDTTDPKYYKWTQWIFLKLLENDLAYQSEIPINWCPSCKTGLANEEVISGKCERCGAQVEKKTLKQWMLKITKYADRLIEDLKDVEYPERVKLQQINWIGKSKGAEIKFKLKNLNEEIKVFTTRADTIFGITAIVLAPEHKLVPQLKENVSNKKEVEEYIKESKRKSEFERTEMNKEKTGVELKEIKAINPLGGEEVPVWIGDYVISTYGGGAVMVVPAHDFRDYDFATKYGIEIREVVSGGNISKEAFIDYGKLINSSEFNGLESKEAIEKIINRLKEKSLGNEKINYKFRDWIFSRQHYWGEPIPIIHCPKCGVVPIPEEDLPVELPYIEKYQPTETGESPLASTEEWVNTTCPKCGGPAKRETDTMPNWAGSNWYYMRYIDPNNNKDIVSPEKLKYWMPVDWYNGGMEHTTLHLLYSRFIYKFLYDIGTAPQKEPYKKRTCHGIVLAEDGRKMSKSFGNVINPDAIIDQYGADTLRIYEMFMGPFDQAILWSNKGVRGCYKFLKKVWNLTEQHSADEKSSKETIKNLHKLIKKIGEDLDKMKFNTAIAAFMEFVNFCSREQLGKDEKEKIIILLSPFAPHISEELWQIIGHKESVTFQKWPDYNKEFIKEDLVNLIIQINGKLRDRIEVSPDVLKEETEKLVLQREKVKKWIGGKEIKKIIFVPGKLINIVF
jgi:leucyl-tRNA synthetase